MIIEMKDYTGYKKVCSFGTRHNLTEKCECSKKFGCLGIVFMDKLKQIGINIEYALDINKEMQNKYLYIQNSKINSYKD